MVSNTHFNDLAGCRSLHKPQVYQPVSALRRSISGIEHSKHRPPHRQLNTATSRNRSTLLRRRRARTVTIEKLLLTDCQRRCNDERRVQYPSWFPVPEEDVSPEPQQESIIDSDAYPMRVLAGAGTGKTFTMVRKIEHLIDEEDVSPDRILALTFTNNAADSMREKLNAKLGTAGYDIDAYTYHSICNEILTDYAYEAGIDPDFEVATDAEKYAIVLDVLDDIEYRSVKPNVYGSDGYASGAASASPALSGR